MASQVSDGASSWSSPGDEPTRSGLVNRILPEMELSSGGETSLTRPPAPIPENLDVTARALYRFAVDGNAVITGGAGTLALECAKALLDHGLQGLALWDINFDHSQATIEGLKKGYPNAKIATIKVDVRVSSTIDVALEDTVRIFGAVNILCCFAGVVGCTPTVDVKAEEWKRIMDINCNGVFLCAQAVARGMISQRSGGSIVLIASLSGHIVNFPQPQAAYNTSKAAVQHLTRCLAAEWAVHGIRVNSISPGYMDTILNEGVGLAKARTMWNARNPMGRMGVPQELTGPLVLLCSRAGSYMNGADIKVDGGASVF
ncbi:uncharacterized protein PV09_04722 [Verruconis gallopava]|uniref:D-arabinitol 2-dehydrogenase [ribulose-forming] n=1 Tax=Verruconis gallopava TaxID=253628 RepID=A0A0D1YUY1_9PEZI|nr:uncharacterized protein PV09_04722 [Verruconis gallopava]KIW04457.1 hypothetical protein PV09_04722 [Verruconis gallopava]